MDELNERTCCTITVSFFDEDDLPVVPTSASYRLDDVGSKTAIVPKTALAALAVTKEIHIIRGWNSILTPSHQYETRRLTVEFFYGGSHWGSNEYLYRVRNLYGVETEASASESASESASAS